MLPDDIMRRQLLEAVSAALGAAGTIVTQEQAILIGMASESQRREVITTILLNTQPVQSMRSFPLCQLMTRGTPSEFASEAHGLAVLLSCALARAARDAKFKDDLFGFARQDLRAGGLNLASRGYYDAGVNGAGAEAIAALGAVISPHELFASVGVSPARFGSGYQGSTSVKGRLATSYGTPVESKAEQHTIGDMVQSTGGVFEEGE